MPTSENSAIPAPQVTADSAAIRVAHLSKMYKVYNRPGDLFWEMLTRKPRHKEFWALRDISFEIGRGQVVGLVGRNGAGKSTILRILAGTLDKTSGSIEVNGKISAILELGTGFHPERTGRENIYMGGLCLGMSRKEIDAKVGQIIDFSELQAVIDQPFRTYSSGMQARLTFSTAVHVEPDIFIVDEALATGDALFQEKCLRKIRAICTSGATVLLVTHSLFHIYEVCSACLLFHESRLLAYGDPRTVGEQYERMLWADRMVVPDNRKRKSFPAIISAAPSSPGEEPLPSLASPFSRPADPPGMEHDAGPERLPSAMAPSNVDAGLSGPPPVELLSLDITNETGRPAVLLVIGQKYKLTMQCRFNETVRQPNFGFCVQKESGLAVTGDTTFENGIRIEGRKDTIVTVTFAFTCRLLSGVYLIGGGVTDIQENGDFRILHVDRALFAVTVAGKPLNGLFDPVCEINYVTAPAGLGKVA
ncbi:MAG: ABC transporter ATP-binding protein [Gemmataceae bacterium]